MLIEKLNSNQPNNSNILPSNNGINTNFRFQNNQKIIIESKFKNKTDSNNNNKKNNYLNPSYTPQYTSQSINLANCVYATPNYQQQSTPQQKLLFDSNFKRAMLSPLYLYNNGNSNSSNNNHNNINRSPNINNTNNNELNYSNSPFCYTPNNNNNYVYNNSNNGMGMLSPLTPNHNLFSISPYTNMFQNLNNQYGFSPIINKQQNMNQNSNNKQKPNNNNNNNNYHHHHNNSFFSFKPSQISQENEDILFDNMLNKKNKSKKIKKSSTNDNLPNPAQSNSNNPKHNFNSLFGTNSINNKQKSQCNLPSKNQTTKSPNINNIQMSPKEDQKNKINIDNILYLKDKRTTLMIKNIPNKYTISTFLDEINVEFKNKYDIFYLPIDYGNKCNLGFAFINFVDPLHIIIFYDMYRGKKWKRFNSEKICELVYAKIQGKKELISHFEKGKVLSFDSEEKRPLILPTPNPLPKIKLPIKLLDTFVKAFPFSSYSFENNNGASANNEFFYIETLYSY